MEIRKLNSLRGIAALIVVISHYSNRSNLLNKMLGRGAGHLGVMLFFILSGFLMSYLYMENDFNKRNVYKYAIARIARVGPLFLVIVLCSYFLQKFGIRGVLYNIPDFPSLTAHLTLFSGVSVLWTIPVEIQFYLVFVFLWWVWKKQQAHLFLLIAFIMVLLLYLGFPRFEGHLLGIPYDTVLFRSLPYFFMGLIFGLLYLKWPVQKRLQKRIFILSLCLIPLFYPKIQLALTGARFRLWNDIGALFCLSFVFFVITFLVPNNDRILSNRVGDFLGKISYSLYLLHLPVLWQIDKNQTQENPVLFLAIFLSLAITISYISYLLIENPLRSVIRAVGAKKQPQPNRNHPS